MTPSQATSRTNEAAERLLDLLESDSARPFLRSVMETNIDDLRAEERRLTVERAKAAVERLPKWDKRSVPGGMHVHRAAVLAILDEVAR